MKKTMINLSMLLVLAILMVSCKKEKTKRPIDFCIFMDNNVALKPVCSFNPNQATDVQFPVQVFVNGVIVSDFDLYDFSWSKDPNFKGSAISVSYDQLPLILTLTELSSDCTAEATLKTDYWD